MKIRVTLLLVLMSFLLIIGRSNGRLLMEKNQFNSPDNPSDFNPNLETLVDNGSHGHADKDAAECDEEICPSSSSSAKRATNKSTSSFKLKQNIQKTKKPKLPATPNGTEGVFNLLQKGEETPSGRSPKVNLVKMTVQRLSKSRLSPGVGHMRMIHDSSRDGKSNKRKLGSSPSPGGGH